MLATDEDGVRYEFTLWATPLPTVKNWRAAFDWPTEGDNFLNWVRVRTTNLGPAPAEARVRLDLLVTNAPAPVAWSASLAPGRSAETCFRIPFKPVATPAAFDKEKPTVWLDRTAGYWRNLMAKAARIEVPCEKATQALLAAHVCQIAAAITACSTAARVSMMSSTSGTAPTRCSSWKRPVCSTPRATR